MSEYLSSHLSIEDLENQKEQQKELMGYNSYQSPDGKPNEENIKQLKEHLLGLEITHKWDCSKESLDNLEIINGKLSIGSQLAFDTSKLAMGMMASAEKVNIGGNPLIKLKYPHVEEEALKSVSELYFAEEQYNNLRKKLRSDLEDRGLLESRFPVDFKELSSRMESLTKKADIEFDLSKFFADEDYRMRIFLYSTLKIFTSINIEGGLDQIKRRAGMAMSQFHHKSPILPGDINLAMNMLKVIYPLFETIYAIKTDAKFAEQFKRWFDFQYNKYGIHLRTGAGAFNNQEYLSGRLERETTFLKEFSTSYNRPGGHVDEIPEASINFLAPVYLIRKIISEFK